MYRHQTSFIHNQNRHSSKLPWLYLFGPPPWFKTVDDLETKQNKSSSDNNKPSYKGSQSVVSSNAVFRAIIWNSELQPVKTLWWIHFKLRLSTPTYIKAQKCILFFCSAGTLKDIRSAMRLLSIRNLLLQLEESNPSPTLQGEGEQAAILSPKTKQVHSIFLCYDFHLYKLFHSSNIFLAPSTTWDSIDLT